jgi:hypothetical protein
VTKRLIERNLATKEDDIADGDPSAPAENKDGSLSR